MGITNSFRQRSLLEKEGKLAKIHLRSVELNVQKLAISFCFYINLLSRMQSFKSSPLLPDGLMRPSRNTRRVSRRRVSKEQEPLVPNPFKDQENYLPSDLRVQVEQLDYISPANLQALNFCQATPGARRSSGFARHLQAMQNAAKKQEEMYRLFTGKPPKESMEACEMEQESPMTIEEDDDVSLRAQHCFFRMDDDAADNADLNFFSGEEEEEHDVIFYSQHLISEGEMQDDYEAYFDV